MKNSLELRKTGVGALAISLLIVLGFPLLTPSVSAAEYKLDYYTFARYVDEGIPRHEPTFPTSFGVVGVFLTVEDYAYFYVKFKEIRAPFTIRWEWYTPDEELYATTEIVEDAPAKYTGYWAWHRIRIGGEIDEELAGVWAAKFYVDDELVVDTMVMILTPQLVWGVAEMADQLLGEVEDLKSNITDYQEQVAKLQEQVKGLEEEIISLKAEEASLSASLEKSEERAGELAEELSIVKSERDVLREQLNTAEEKLDRSSDKVEELERYVDDLSTQRMALIAVAAVFAVIAVLGFMTRRRPVPAPSPSTTGIENPPR